MVRSRWQMKTYDWCWNIKTKTQFRRFLIRWKRKRRLFFTKVDDFHVVFSLRDEIGMCPFIKDQLKLKDETPFFVQPYPIWEEQKKFIQKEMDRLEHLGIICKGLTGYSSPVVWSKERIKIYTESARILEY